MADDEHVLQLSCPGCGQSVGVEEDSRLVDSVRPFVETHRACPDRPDREMRSAYSRPT